MLFSGELKNTGFGIRPRVATYSPHPCFLTFKNIIFCLFVCFAKSWTVTCETTCCTARTGGYSQCVLCKCPRWSTEGCKWCSSQPCPNYKESVSESLMRGSLFSLRKRSLNSSASLFRYFENDLRPIQC